MRILMVIPIGLLACAVAAGQESRVAPVPVTQGAYADTASPTFRLAGVLISKSSRSALINGRPYREGDRVAGVEILTIDSRRVRVRAGTRELVVEVGGSMVLEPSPDVVDGTATARINSNARHAVKRGETLSDIALRYRRDGTTMNQMMTALFHANPQAFDDNINMLFEGAVLSIPHDNELLDRTPAIAAAEVVQHANRWAPAQQQQVSSDIPSRNRQYGPVKRGETLSGIAASLLPDGVSIDQMMVALFQENRPAFDRNINLLYAGAILRIPDIDAVHQYSPATATAEVDRQRKGWQGGEEQRALPDLPHDGIVASASLVTVPVIE